MAHQAHNIPWQALASNFEWRLTNPCEDNASDFHWRRKPGQGKRLTHFVNAFAKNIREHADGERKKYPEEYEHPEHDEIMLSDEVCRRINPTVRHWRLNIKASEYPYDDKSENTICPHRHPEGSHLACECPLPWRERRMEAFTRVHQRNSCYEFYDKNKDAFFNLEVFKTLLMHGEMDVLFRIYSHPHGSLHSWWNAMACQCEGPDMGWSRVSEFALRSYILLNIIQCFPETWRQGHERTMDYRNTRVYQAGVRDLTESGGNSDLVTYPHRQFFGIADGQFSRWWSSKRTNKATLERFYSGSYPLGRMPYGAFLTFEKDVHYMPLASDVFEVRWALQVKGLPNELVDSILGMTQYGKNTSTRRLPVAHDPFHPENRSELDKYLKYCWILLVRCELVARTIGMEIKWEEQVSEALIDLFKCPCVHYGKNRIVTRDWDDPKNSVRFL